MDCWKEKISGSGTGSGKGRGRKKKHPPRRGMGVAQLERIRTQQQQQQQQDLPSFPNVCCCAHRSYSDLNPFPFGRLKKKRVNGEEIEGLWGGGTEIICSLPIHLGEGEGEGAKVLAVHQRGGKGADGKLVMEYGFFPASPAGAGAAAAASCAPGDSSTSIDLSLRL